MKPFQAEHDETAKELAEKLLTEKNLSDKTHRCTSPSGKLLLFHSNFKKTKKLMASLFYLFPINLGGLFSINALNSFLMINCFTHFLLSIFF